MSLKRNIPFHKLIERSVARRSKLVNNYRVKPKAGKYGVPALLLNNAIINFNGVHKGKRIDLTPAFAEFLRAHMEHIVIYWPRNGDHNEVTVVIDSKHSRNIQTLYAEFIGRRIINTNFVLRNSKTDIYELNEKTVMHVGEWLDEHRDNGDYVGWAVPNENYLPTLFKINERVRKRLDHGLLIAKTGGWQIVEMDEFFKPLRRTYLNKEDYPTMFYA